MNTIEHYKKRSKELEDDPLVREYAYIQKLIRLAESPAYNIRVNKPTGVIPEKLLKPDGVEKKEESVTLKLLRWLSRASTVNEINKAFYEFYYEEADLKYKIRHQFKRGNIYLLSYNESRKYSFYVMPEWIENDKLKNKYLPLSSNVPHMIDSIRIKSYDGKINKEML